MAAPHLLFPHSLSLCLSVPRSQALVAGEKSGTTGVMKRTVPTPPATRQSARIAAQAAVHTAVSAGLGLCDLIVSDGVIPHFHTVYKLKLALLLTAFKSLEELQGRSFKQVVQDGNCCPDAVLDNE